jgi:hypothetical protein
MIEDFIKSYIGKLKDCKKFAREKNVAVWFIPLIDSILITYFVSWMISYHTWVYLGEYQEIAGSSLQMKWLWEFSVYLPFILWASFVLSVLPRLTKVMIYFHHYAGKAVFLAINKFDMWYWKKYRKESVLANAIWKSQSKFMGIDKQRKRQIIVLFLVGVVIYYVIRLELV